MKTISASQLKLLIDTAETPPFLLDVREPHEFDYCHIANSHLIPMQSIPSQLDQLSKTTPIITICHHGMRSQQVAQYLMQHGFKDITNLTGGVHAWASEVEPAMPTY